MLVARLQDFAWQLTDSVGEEPWSERKRRIRWLHALVCVGARQPPLHQLANRICIANRLEQKSWLVTILHRHGRASVENAPGSFQTGHDNQRAPCHITQRRQAAGYTLDDGK